MKYFILGAMLTTSAMALPFPRVINWGNRVEVQINNFENRQVRCSGPVYLRTLSGNDSQSIFAYLSPRQNFYRNIYPRRNERVVSVSHSIFCY